MHRSSEIAKNRPVLICYLEVLSLTRWDQKNLMFFGEIKYSMVDVGAGVDIDVLNINEVGPVKRDTSSLKVTK